MKNYQIALTNVDFDNSYENCVRFDSRAEQEGYFKCNTLFADAPFVNLDFGTLLNTRIPIRRDLIPTKLMGYNYLIVKDTSDDKDLDYLYYFVKDIYYDTANQVILDVELDVINTYLLSVDFSDCFIEKAHLNRFIDNGDNTVSFDGTENSKLFETEDLLPLPKRLTKRTKLKLKYTGNDEIDNWLNENVLCWCYVFVDKMHTYNIKKLDGNSNTSIPAWGTLCQYDIDNYKENMEYGVIAYPITKGNKSIRCKYGTTYITLGAQGFRYFRDLNNNSSYFYTVKYSLIPPFYIDELTRYTISENALNLYESVTISDDFMSIGGTNMARTNSGTYGVFFGLKQNKNKIESYLYENNLQYKFSKSEIINANKNVKYNPKLLGENFKNLTLTSQGELFNYDLQKINSNNISFLYTEPVQSEVTKFYLRLKAPTGLYIEDTNNNYMGVVGNVDNSMAIANDQYSNFLASNKNFWLQSNLKIGERVINAYRNPDIGNTLNTVNAIIDKSLTIDNMRNAPSSLQNANGNAIFNNFVTDLGIYAEEYDALQNEKEMVNDVMFKNGFTVNRIGNVKDYLNIRKYFNYVRARLENITSALQLNNNIREKFKMIFANGVRFWNVTDKMFEYKKENYERWLNE